MTAYKHIFFDLDHTLWDFNVNCFLTLEELYESYQLHHLGFPLDAFQKTYLKINNQMWDGFHKGTVTKEDIREKRFEYTFNDLGYQKKDVPGTMENDFLRICPAKGRLFPYTYEVLDYLKEKYTLHIITNGFKETQHIKLSTSGLSKYFKEVIESDVCGFKKPDKRIFDHALELGHAKKEESLMIGDDFEADVLGARNAGIDQVFVNRNNFSHKEMITYEIDCLSKLKEIL